MKKHITLYTVLSLILISCSVKINVHDKHIDDLHGPVKSITWLKGIQYNDSSSVLLEREFKLNLNKKKDKTELINILDKKYQFKNSYDNNNRLILSKKYFNDSLELFTRYKYNPNMNEEVEISYTPDSSIVDGWIYKYKADNIIEKTRIHRDSTIYYTTKAEFNIMGNLKRLSRYYENGESDVNIYNYPLFKREIYIEYYENDSLWHYAIQKYDKKQNIIKTSLFESNGQFVNSEIGYYDSQNFLISDRYEFPDSSKNYRKEYVNDYYGNWITKTLKSKDYITIDYRIIEYYEKPAGNSGE